MQALKFRLLPFIWLSCKSHTQERNILVKVIAQVTVLDERYKEVD